MTQNFPPNPEQENPYATPQNGNVAGEGPAIPNVPPASAPGVNTGEPGFGASPYTQPGAMPGQMPYQGGFNPNPQTNSLALASLILSLLGLLTWITAPIGAILGHIARRQIRETEEGGDGLALGGIIVGWVITALGAVALVGLILLVAVSFNAVSNMSPEDIQRLQELSESSDAAGLTTLLGSYL